MKVGILYICTGKYSVFWKDFYESAESLLLRGHDKQYFVFTDATEIAYEQKENVHKIFEEKYEWPLPTVLRFHAFVRAEDLLKKMDYLFFFNANMKVVSEITGEDIFPDPVKEDGLTVVLHSGYYKAKSSQFPYEKYKGSLAYLESGRYYFQGSFSGGTSAAYLKMAHQLKENIQKDLDNNFIATWWDESHLNKYMVDKNPKIVSPAYSYSEGKQFEFAPKLLMLNKAKLGSYKYMRGQKESLLEKIKYFIKKKIK
ncbi:MAG: family 6 glucosyltransferase [Bacteroidota bacterium]|nr:family 6 glucosyltransferase [Bacteroidota bacterium]